MTGNNNNRPIIEPLPETAAAADVKKLTMKGLKLELNDLSGFIEDDVLGKLVELANAIEAHNKAFVIVSNNLDAIQQSVDLIATAHKEANTLDTLTEMATDINALQEAQGVLSRNQTLLQEGMFILSGDVMKANPPTPAPPLVTMDAPEEIIEQIPEEIPEPEEIQFGTPQHPVLEAIADSCIVMNDILLLCKAMKKVPELVDQSRIALLDLAGRRAGIQITPGMQIRAGVKMVVA